MSHVLITGGAGFIGSHVARALVSGGHSVVVLDDLSGGSTANVPNGALFVRGSILDVDLLQRMFAKYRFTHVYHLAAYAAEGLSHFIRRFNYTNNVIGSMNLINESVRHGVRCFVFTSSIAVYGHCKPPVREDDVPVPADPYGIAKLAVEQDLKCARDMFGMDFIIFRPHNVYGEMQNIGDRYRNVVGIFMNQIMSGQPLTIFGDGQQTRAFTYIADVAPLIAWSVDVEAAMGQTFNIGADQPYTVNELAAAVSAAMGVPLNARHVEARNETVHAFADHDAVQRAFGLRTPTPLHDGLTRMAAWARRVGARQSQRFDGVELSKNLPPVWLDAD